MYSRKGQWSLIDNFSFKKNSKGGIRGKQIQDPFGLTFWGGLQSTSCQALYSLAIANLRSKIGFLSLIQKWHFLFLNI